MVSEKPDKIEVQNVWSQPLPLPDGELGVAQKRIVVRDEVVERHLEEGHLVIPPAEKKEGKG